MALDQNNAHVQIAIIGSGFGGLGAAVQFKRNGFDDFVVLERADDVGGVWRDNSYPGCACDVKSHLYSFSFFPNAEWSRSYSSQPEIWAYLRRCAQECGIMPHMRFRHEVREATWDSAAQRWRLETSQGSLSAAILVMAVGALSDPVVPNIPGLERFQGAAFHSARWDHTVDLRGKRVAVIGTGASAIQFIPAIQPLVERLYVFQRTPPWVLPREDYAHDWRTRRLFARFPQLQLLMRGWIYGTSELMVLALRHPRLMGYVQRLAERYLEQSVPDPALRAKLTPNYTLGCKRMLISNDYLPALTQPNVEVVTERVGEVREHTVVASDGAERAADVIIFGTGFHVTDMPFAAHVRGRTGQTLAEVWGGSPEAYLGTTVAKFPNLFILQGPNTGLGHTSVITMIEAQIAHMLSAVQYMRRRGLATLEPRPEAQAAFVADVQRQMQGTVWTAGGCRSWYLDVNGRNSTLWPSFTWQFRRQVARLNPSAYVQG